METSPTGDTVLGFDTGFFQRLYARDAQATAAWDDVRAGHAVGAISCVTLFEIERLGLRGGVLPRDVADGLVRSLPVTCRVVWLGADDGADRLHRAVRLAHGNGLAMADAIILTSLLDAGATTVYTTDSDFDRYDGPVHVVQL